MLFTSMSRKWCMPVTTTVKCVLTMSSTTVTSVSTTTTCIHVFCANSAAVNTSLCSQHQFGVCSKA